MNFKTRPRFIGEYAKSQYEMSKTLQKRYSANPEYVTARISAQESITKCIKMYNRSMITSDEAMKWILKASV